MNPIIQYAGRVQSHLMADPRVLKISLSVRHPPGSNETIACLDIARKDGAPAETVEITKADFGMAAEDKAEAIAKALPAAPKPKAKPKAKAKAKK